MKSCIYCGSNENVYLQFGKMMCIKCIVERKTGKKGNSGMIYKNIQGIQTIFNEDDETGLSIQMCEKSNPQFVKWFIEHYPQSKGIPGRSINYIVYNNNIPVGIIGANSPPLNYILFNNFFNLKGTGKDGTLFVNNNVFRIVSGVLTMQHKY